MINLQCASCDAPPVDADISMMLSAEELAKAVAAEGFERCDHCRTFHHRIQCFTFHKATQPVPFSSRQAERMERKRLAWLEAA